MTLRGMVLVAALPLVVHGQSTLGEAADRARQAWLAHDPLALVGQSSTEVGEFGLS